MSSSTATVLRRTARKARKYLMRKQPRATMTRSSRQNGRTCKSIWQLQVLRPKKRINPSIGRKKHAVLKEPRWKTLLITIKRKMSFLVYSMTKFHPIYQRAYLQLIARFQQTGFEVSRLMHPNARLAFRLQVGHKRKWNHSTIRYKPFTDHKIIVRMFYWKIIISRKLENFCGCVESWMS